MAYFTKEVNPRFAKSPLKTNGPLAYLELTSLVKETTGGCLAAGINVYFISTTCTSYLCTEGLYRLLLARENDIIRFKQDFAYFVILCGTICYRHYIFLHHPLITLLLNYVNTFYPHHVGLTIHQSPHLSFRKSLPYIQVDTEMLWKSSISFSMLAVTHFSRETLYMSVFGLRVPWLMIPPYSGKKIAKSLI